MVLSIIFLEDKHKVLLHLSIFYEFFSTPYLFLDTAATSTRKFTQKSQIFHHKTSPWFCLSYFLKTNIKLYCIYQYFMSIDSFFNTVSVSRYSCPITVTRDPDQQVPAVFSKYCCLNRKNQTYFSKRKTICEMHLITKCTNLHVQSFLPHLTCLRTNMMAFSIQMI